MSRLEIRLNAFRRSTIPQKQFIIIIIITVSTGEYFLRGKYLKMRRSRSTRYHKFSILPGDALCRLEEVFEVFDDISDDLTLDKETFIALQMLAGAL